MSRGESGLTPEQIEALSTQMAGKAAEEEAKKLHAKRLQTMAELAQHVPHYEQTMHKNDCPHAKTRDGKRTHLRVRVDGGDSKTPVDERQYWMVPAGYGEGRRVARVRAAAKAGATGCSAMSSSYPGTDREIIHINPKAVP